MPIVLPSMARPTLTEPTYLTPPVWKPVLAWAGLVMGGIILVGALGTLGSGVLESVAMALIGLARAVAGGWWVFCEREDRTQLLQTDIETLERAIEQVLEMLERVSNYVSNVLDEEAEPSSALGQFLMNTLALAPKVEPEQVERDFNNHIQVDLCPDGV